jgi:hypothetical protein
MMTTSAPTPTTPAPPPSRLGGGTGRSAPRRVVLAVAIIVMVILFGFGAWSAIGFATLHRVDQHHSFAFTGSRLVVDAEEGGLHVSAGQPGRVEVDSHFHYSQLSPAHPSMRMDGDQLIAKTGCRSVMNNYCTATYELRVPANTTLQLHTSDGNILVSGITGDLDLRTSDGAIHADGATGRLQLHTSDGSITARNLRGTTISAVTSDGRVLLTFAVDPAQVTARSSDGDVEITVPRDGTAYKVDAATSDGSRQVDVATNPDGSRSIFAHTSDGAVRVLRAAS